MKIHVLHKIYFNFRVFADPTGHVTIQYKELSNDAVWKPTIDEPALEIFKLDNDRRQKIPAGLPEVVEPKLDEEELQDLKRCAFNNLLKIFIQFSSPPIVLLY